MRDKAILLHLFWVAACATAPFSAKALASSACAPGETVTGVDVSNYQLDTLWEQVQGSGRRFAFIKATEGANIENSEFKTDWPASKSAGLIRGAYHYYVPTDDPVEQADFFLSTVGELGSGDLPATLDLEVTDGVPASTIITEVKLWLEQVEQATGRAPIIYTNPGYWISLGNPSGFEPYPLFIANYEVSCPELPPSWTHWVFWQQSPGSTPGIPGVSDLDIFNGSTADLKAFSAGKTIHMPVPKPRF